MSQFCRVQWQIVPVNTVPTSSVNIKVKSMPWNFTYPSLRELLKKRRGMAFVIRHAKAFQKIKIILANPEPGVLTYHDMTKPVKLQFDASKSGLGAVLIQSNLRVAFASRSLTPAETRYAQIERELLAVMFGCNRFYQYIDLWQTNCSGIRSSAASSNYEETVG